MEGTTYSARFNIGDKIQFYPYGRQSSELVSGNGNNDPENGQIVSVKFTKSKVFYTILDDYYAVLYQDIDSALVEPIEIQELETIKIADI